MKPLFLTILSLLVILHSEAQCPASGTPIQYTWVNPEGTYLDLGSKRDMDKTHHKLYDLRTLKAVGTGVNTGEYPYRGYGFVYETDCRIRKYDFTTWRDNNTSISVTENGKEVFRKTFTKYACIYLDSTHRRAIIQEPTEYSWYKLYYLELGKEPELIEKRFSGNLSPGAFTPDGKYLVGGGAVIDMNARELVTSALAKKTIFYGYPVMSLDSRYVAYDTKKRSVDENRYMRVYDLNTREMVREIHVPDSFNQYYITLVPIPDMKRAAVVPTYKDGRRMSPARAYILSEEGLLPLCFPGWTREIDEYLGKTITVYNEPAPAAGNGCNMDAAAIETDGKYELTISGQNATLYLSARATGEVSGTYTYTSGTTKIKGKLSGKLTTVSGGGAACVHTVSGTYDETLFGGAKGTLKLSISSDGKAISGTAGSAAWSGKKS